MGIVRDLTGQRFGRLVAVERIGSSAKGNATWKCVCDCGSQKLTHSHAFNAWDSAILANNAGQAPSDKFSRSRQRPAELDESKQPELVFASCGLTVHLNPAFYR